MKSGIYLIVCKKNDCVYIGRAANVVSRLYQHFYLLEKGKHHNKLLQADFDKFGLKEFEAQFVESVTGVDAMKKAEKVWAKKNQNSYTTKLGRVESGKKFAFVDLTI